MSVNPNRLSVLLEFTLVERNEPGLDPTSKSGIRRGKIKDGQKPIWISQWIPWEPQMDVTTFVRNLKRELASQCFACRGDVERDLTARILQAKAESADYSPATPCTVITPHRATATAHIPSRSSTSQKKKQPRLVEQAEAAGGEATPAKRRNRTCPNCHADTMLRACACAAAPSPAHPQQQSTPATTHKQTSGGGAGIGKGKKLCKNCNSVIASSRKECPMCDTPCHVPSRE